MTNLFLSFIINLLPNLLGCANFQVDESVVREISAGWKTAIAASEICNSFESTSQTKIDDRAPYSFRTVLRKNGNKFMLGISQNGNESDPGRKVSFIRIFNQQYQALATAGTTVDQEFSRQQPWVMTDLKLISEAEAQLIQGMRYMREAGVKFGNCNVCLSYLFPENEHIRVDKLTSETKAGGIIWKMEWSIVLDKLPKDFRTPLIKNGILWLDPGQSYLPVRSEIGDPGVWWIKDSFVYRPNLSSYYCEKISSDYELTPNGERYVVAIQTQLNATSDGQIGDEVFTLSNYGLAEPDIIADNNFPWYLIVLGLIIVVGGYFVQRFVQRNN